MLFLLLDLFLQQSFFVSNFMRNFELLLDENVEAREQICIRSACFLTASSHIKPLAHPGAADGKQTSSCESRRLAANKTPGLAQGLGSSPPSNSVCADTRLNLKPTQSGRRDEDVHQARAVKVVHISPLEIMVTRA